jgi:hypothetical protein
MQNDQLPTTRAAARAQGVVAYFTGQPCSHGHIDKRYTGTGRCYACQRARNNGDYADHTDRVKEIKKRSYAKNRIDVIAASAAWAKANQAKANQYKRDYTQRNREKCRALSRDYLRERLKDPLFRRSRAMVYAIRRCLKGQKTSRRWEALVGFTLDELRQHLESKFTEGMSWDNYGPFWAIDHIKPISRCESFEEAWTLSNLQPLTHAENSRKRDRWPYHGSTVVAAAAELPPRGA